MDDSHPATNPKPDGVPAEVPAAASPQAESPAVHYSRPGFLGFFDKLDKGVKPVSYSPLSGIAVFPVVKHGREKAFGDLPLIFAREYAQRLELKVPETRVYHPIYAVDEIRIRGLGHVYDQIMSYYIKAGRPEPAAMDYLLKQFAASDRPISRVIFVEADLNTSHPTATTNPLEWVSQFLTDGTPKQARSFVHSRLQVFDAEDPDFPMVWGGSWTRSIKTDAFLNVTPSVFSDSDSQQAFAKLSRQMSRELLFATPRAAYAAPQYDTAVQGRLAADKNTVEPSPDGQPSAKSGHFPNFTEMRNAGNSLSDENKEAIQRILRRQNAITP